MRMIAGDWKFEEYFSALDNKHADTNNAVILQARRILNDCEISKHQFFVTARKNSNALRVWAAQEAVITNHFSQVLLCFLSQVKNVHIRSLLMPVIAGEHSEIKKGLAYGSHPNLLAKLVQDLGISTSEIRPIECTVQFANALDRSTLNWFEGLGFLGIGNEAMLVPEYEAVETAFAHHFERSIYRPFLRANIEEDKSHSDLMDQAAMFTISSEADASKYLEGARSGVASRLEYYDRLLEAVS